MKILSLLIAGVLLAAAGLIVSAAPARACPDHVVVYGRGGYAYAPYRTYYPRYYRTGYHYPRYYSNYYYPRYYYPSYYRSGVSFGVGVGY